MFFEHVVCFVVMALNMRSSAVMSTDGRHILGKIGEDLACRELCRRGYAILARRYRTRLGEIDIVARDGETIVFVEVKARRDTAFGGAGAAVTLWKQQRVARMAADFLARSRCGDAPCRFDVVAIDFERGRPRIEVYVDAFTAHT